MYQFFLRLGILMAIAWLHLFVFAATCTAQENDKTHKLLTDLNSNRYVARETATKQLLQIIDFDLYFKLRATKGESPEVRGRITYLMQKFENSASEDYPFDLGDHDDFPWICWGLLYSYRWKGSSYWQIRDSYLESARQSGMPVGDEKNGWADWRYATKLWVADRLAFALKESLITAKSKREVTSAMEYEMQAIEQDMARMREGEYQWWKHAKKLLPALPVPP